jgi:hypothetical protein
MSKIYIFLILSPCLSQAITAVAFRHYSYLSPTFLGRARYKKEVRNMEPEVLLSEFN